MVLPVTLGGDPGTSEKSDGELRTYWREDAIRRVESLSQFAQALWKSLMLVNGGAIVAILTFIGNTKITVDPASIWWAMACFVVGLAATMFSTLAAYICQSGYMRGSAESLFGEDTPTNQGEGWEWAAIAGIGAGIACFLVGSFIAMSAVLAPKAATQPVLSHGTPSAHGVSGPAVKVPQSGVRGGTGPAQGK